MKLVPVLLVLACSLVVALQAGAEPRSEQLTPQKPDGNFVIKVKRVEDTDFLQFRVTVKLKDDKDLPTTRGVLRIFDGKEYISLSAVQPTGPEGDRLFFFQVAAKYAAKSKFSYSQVSDFDFNEYWFHLKDFVEAKAK